MDINSQKKQIFPRHTQTKAKLKSFHIVRDVAKILQKLYFCGHFKKCLESLTL